MPKTLKPISPGEILLEEFMTPMGISQNRLARDIKVPPARVNDIVPGRRAITADTALRLARYFGTSAELWMQFQSDFDLFVARNSEWKDIAPRVREMQPIDPNAVAPVTALDAHADHMDDFLDDHADEDVSEIMCNGPDQIFHFRAEQKAGYSTPEPSPPPEIFRRRELPYPADSGPCGRSLRDLRPRLSRR